jgi:origin recognition complex subunit 3
MSLQKQKSERQSGNERTRTIRMHNCLSDCKLTARYGRNKKSEYRQDSETPRQCLSYKIQNTLEGADSAVQQKIVDFVSTASSSPDEQKFAIPTGLIVAGPSIASHGPFFERLGLRIKKDTKNAYVVLTSGESPNLKTLLKNLIKKVTSHVEDDDDDDDMDRPASSARNGPKLLNFDLGLVQEWRKKNRVSSIVVAFQDSEAFDAGLIADVTELFQ